MSNINSQIDYMNDDASVELINNINRRRREIQEEQARVNNIALEEAKIERAIANSVGKTVNRIMYDNERAKTIERQRKNRIKATVGTVLILVSLSTGLIIANADEIKTNKQVEAITNNEISSKSQLLISRKLAVKADGNRPFTILDNKISDYMNLHVTSSKDVYTYMEVFGNNKEEFNKFIRSVYYYDINGEICYYESFEDFLIRNGYTNEKDFEDQIKNQIKEEIEINLNGQMQTFTYADTTNKKGGRS